MSVIPSPNSPWPIFKDTWTVEPKIATASGRSTRPTIFKEIVSLHTAWNWGVWMQFLSGRFPAAGLRYPKVDEKQPFMTRAEILRRIESGGKAKEPWHSLFLTIAEIQELLGHVQQHAEHGSLYPMFCFAAHTGARRSELLRAELGDVDLAGETLLLRERKRVRGKRTTRRVPLSPFLREALQQWLAIRVSSR